MLPRPPDDWLRANGYVGWWTLNRRQQIAASQAYEYERANSRPPPGNFPEGTRAEAQWEYAGGGDPLALAE